MKLLISLSLGLAFALGITGASASAAEALVVGDVAPDFAMEGSDGKTYKLSDLKGKAVVVAWYPRAFTGGCTKECKAFKTQGGAIREFNVAYFTASTDPVDKNKKFAEELEVDYPILSDPDGSVATTYGVLKPGGNAAQRWTFYIGPDGKILYIDKSVKTETHGTDVAAKLKELGVKKKS